MSTVASMLGSGLFTLVAFLFVLSIVVVVHEMGHFLVARWCGVKVDAFAMGFGREVFGWNDSKGTRWRLNWIPLGGYVKFMDDANGASMPDAAAIDRMSPEERATSFHAKPLWQRAAVIFAGPFANFLLAVALLATLFMVWGVRTFPAKVEDVVVDSPAARAGLRPGDMIVEVDGTQIASFIDLLRIVTVNPGRELALTYERDGKRTDVKVTPERREESDLIGGKVQVGRLGIKSVNSPTGGTFTKYGPIDAVALGVKESVFLLTSNLQAIGKMLTGREDTSQLGGPLRIAAVAGKAASIGFDSLLNLAALVSLGVGLFNLFPVPPLDGGHLLFYAAEAVRGRPLSDNAKELGFRMGFALILMLFMLVMWNDRLVVKTWMGG
jgi:regulator of sigma E protease